MIIFDQNVRLYQQVASILRKRIQENIYTDKLPSEKEICAELNVSRSVVREAIIMLEVEGYVEAKKGSGIHILSTSADNLVFNLENNINFLSTGPFELLQARQLIESHIAEFAATQITKEDIIKLLTIQKQSELDDCTRDSNWDYEFHIYIAKITKNSALITIIETMCQQRKQNHLWNKLHEHIEASQITSWSEQHKDIIDALIRKDPKAAKEAMWQHLENTKQMLFNAASKDFDLTLDKYLYSDNPVKF